MNTHKKEKAVSDGTRTQGFGVAARDHSYRLVLLRAPVTAAIQFVISIFNYEMKNDPVLFTGWPFLNDV